MFAEMTESTPSRRPAYFALAAIAVVLGFVVVFWPPSENRGVQSLSDSAASHDKGPTEAKVKVQITADQVYSGAALELALPQSILDVFGD
jgi:hypothetical protein